MKRLTFLLAMILSVFAVVSCKDKIDVNGSGLPSVLTRPAEDLTFESAYLQGHISGKDVTVGTVGFVYDKRDDFDPEHSPRETVEPDAKEFCLTLKHLESDAEYAYQAFAVLDGKETFGGTEVFRTEPAVFTGEAENVTGNSAKLVGYIATTNVQDAGFIMDKRGQINFQTSPRRRNVPHTTNSITSSANTLESDMAYEYAAYVKIDGIEKYGDVVSFSTAAVPVTSVTLQETSMLIYREDNNSYNLHVEVKPSNATNPKVTWTSSDPKVATVSEGGLVRAIGDHGGVTIIKVASVQSPSIYATCEVTVKGFPPDFSVDMGLPSHRLWRSRDLGAGSDIAYGQYFAWGETANKNYFVEDNYEFYSKAGGRYYPWKYTGTLGHWGRIPDKRTYLEMEDDAARAILGGSWRIPSYQDYLELKMNTTQQETTIKGSKGMLFTAKNPDRKGKYNTLFFPYQGYMHGKIKGQQYGDFYPFDPYWLNQVSVNYVIPPGESNQVTDYTQSSVMYFGQGADLINDRSFERHYGARIRPVCD